MNHRQPAACPLPGDDGAAGFDREVFALPTGLEVRIEIATRRFAELKARRRSPRRGLVAISAPTAMACRLAEQSGLVLAGFARDDRLVGYAHSERLLPG